MQSERKKLGQFNQIPTENMKSAADTKFKSERKFEEREHLFSKPYCPEVQQFPDLQQIIAKNPFPMEFHEVFPLTSDPFLGIERNYQAQSPILYEKLPYINYPYCYNPQKQTYASPFDKYINEFVPMQQMESSDSQNQDRNNSNTNTYAHE